MSTNFVYLGFSRPHFHLPSVVGVAVARLILRNSTLLEVAVRLSPGLFLVRFLRICASSLPLKNKPAVEV